MVCGPTYASTSPINPIMFEARSVFVWNMGSHITGLESTTDHYYKNDFESIVKVWYRL
jgi:hypothetical protein